MAEIETSNDRPFMEYCRATALGYPDWAWAELAVDAAMLYGGAGFSEAEVRRECERRLRAEIEHRVLPSAKIPYLAAERQFLKAMLRVSYEWRVGPTLEEWRRKRGWRDDRDVDLPHGHV